MVLRIFAVSLVLILTPVASLAQIDADGFVYVSPRFTPGPESAVTVANLGSGVAEVEIEFYTENGTRAGTFLTLLPATVETVSAEVIGATSIGSLVVSSLTPIQVSATLDDEGILQVAAPTDIGTNIIVPFAHGTRGSTVLDLFNPGRTDARLFVFAIGPAGETLAGLDLTLPARANLHKDLRELFPEAAVGNPVDVSHIVVRSPVNFFQPRKDVAASAVVLEYSNVGEGVTSRSDPALTAGTSESGRVSVTRLPLFVEGGGFFSLIQLINAATVPQAVTLRALDQESHLIEGSSNPITVSIGAGGSLRAAAGNLFGFEEGSVHMGSVAIDGTQPIAAVAAIGNTPGSSLSVLPSVTGGSANLLFTTREVDREFYDGVALINPNATDTEVSLAFVRNDGTTVSRSSIEIPAYWQVTRTLAELMPEVREAGFILAGSTSPVK